MENKTISTFEENVSAQIENQIVQLQASVFSEDNLLTHIFCHLNLYDLMNCMRVSKRFLNMVQQDNPWQKQLKVHFPGLFETFSQDFLNIAGWYWRFQQIWQINYGGKSPLNKNLRRCIIWIREDNLEAFKKEMSSINPAKFNLFHLLSPMAEKNQEWFDIVYGAVLDHPDTTEKLPTFHLAMACRQPPNIIKTAKIHWRASRNGDYLFTAKWAAHFGDITSLESLVPYVVFNEPELAMCLLGACRNGHLEVISFLLNYAKKSLAYTDETIKSVVSTFYNTKIHNHVYCLADSKEDSFQSSVIFKAIENGRIEILKSLLLLFEATKPILLALSDPLPGRLSCEAAKRGYLEILKLLIQYDPDFVSAPDLYGQTPFLWASVEGHVSILNYLYNEHNKKVDIEIQSTVPDDVDDENDSGKTPLCWAAQNGHIRTVKWLLEKNANIYAKTKAGAMPIHLAAQNGHLTIIKMLLAKNPNLLNEKDNDGYTPLIYTLNLQKMIGKKDLPHWDRIAKTQTFLLQKTDKNDIYFKKFLCFAIQEGFLTILDSFKNDVTVDLVRQTGINPLSMALKARLIKTPKLLLGMCPDLVNEPDKEGRLPISYVQTENQELRTKLYTKIIKNTATDVKSFIAQLLSLKTEQYPGYLASLYLAGQPSFHQHETIIAFLQRLPPEKFNVFLRAATLVDLLSLDNITEVVNSNLELGKPEDTYQNDNATFVNQFIKPLNTERHAIEASIQALELEINNLPDGDDYMCQKNTKQQLLTLVQDLKKYTRVFFSEINPDQETIAINLSNFQQACQKLMQTANKLDEFSFSEAEKLKVYKGILIALHFLIITIPFIWAISASRNCLLGKTDRRVKAEEVLEAVDEFSHKLPQYYPSLFTKVKPGSADENKDIPHPSGANDALAQGEVKLI